MKRGKEEYNTSDRLHQFSSACALRDSIVVLLFYVYSFENQFTCYTLLCLFITQTETWLLKPRAVITGGGTASR